MTTDKYNAGMKVRRDVLGDAYVDKALSNATEFTKPLQDMVTENCWGEIWKRPGIDKKTRSLITLGILTSLRATTELKTHVRGALRNGCTDEGPAGPREEGFYAGYFRDLDGNKLSDFSMA